MKERLQHENFGYLDTQRPFIETVVEWNKRRYGIDIDPNTVVMSEGVHPALIAAIQTFSPPGSKVLLLAPTYDGFYSDITFTRTKAEESPLKLVNGRYTIDFDDFERRISHDTNSFILCNPQNPTGNFWSAGDLMRLGEICLRRRVVVLADEIHCDFVNNGSTYTPFSSLPDKDVVRNSITFKSASKSFGLSAMKCAWFFSTNPDYLARVRSNYRADISTLGLFASQGAYSGGAEWLDQAVTYLNGTHDLVESYVRAHLPLVKYTKAQGTFLAWLDVSALPGEDWRQGTRRGRKREKLHRAARHAGDDRAAVSGPKREGSHESGFLVRSRRRRAHADEHRHVAHAGGACAREHVRSDVALLK